MPTTSQFVNDLVSGNLKPATGVGVLAPGQQGIYGAGGNIIGVVPQNNSTAPAKTATVTQSGAGGSTGGTTPITTSTNQSGGGTGVGGTSLNAPLYVQGIQQEYGAVLNNAPKARQILTQQEQGLEGQYQHGADIAIANAQQQNAGNQAVLQSQIEGTKKGQALSLAELANQIRAQYQGLGAQLGAVGAGSSSARELGARGLAEEQNTQRANIEQQAGSNISNLQTQQTAQNADTNTLIEGYRKTAADQIATVKNNYAQLMNQLQVQLDQAQGEEKARLAEFGQALTDAAKQSLANIEANLSNNTNSLLTQGAAKLTEGSLPTVQNVNPISYQAPNPNSGVSPAGGNTTSTGAPGGLVPFLRDQANQPITQ